MNKALKIITAIALMALGFSCSKLEQTPQFTSSNTAVTITASTATVASVAADSLKDAVVLNWNDPKYSVGLTKSKFSILVGLSGSNFVSFSAKAFTGVVTGSLLGKEANAAALKFGGVIGTPIKLDVKLVASQSNNNEQKESNVLSITVTPYGDLGLTPLAASIVPDPTTPSAVGITFNWTNAFNGYSGVKTYQLQYAKTGTSFASPTSVDVSGYSKSFTHLELNNIALSSGGAASVAGNVEFRIKSTNELGTIVYSNTSIIKITPYVAINSVGIIGDASAGGWDTDTDMYRPDSSKPSEWTANVYLIGGKSAKFRADDDWATNWGASGFPSGTGTQNGANIPVANSGYYTVKFNAASGVYSFTSITTTVYTGVGLIGAQSGWGSEIANLTKDPNNNQIWTGTIALTAGELKFRANQDWGFNWGAASSTTATSLSGYGVNNGSNMVIPSDGTYFVYINVATGDYFFGKSNRNVAYNDIGIIGDATAGGWSTDTNLIKNPANPYQWSGKLTLTTGEAKFRADNDWAVNWGNASFPNGVATDGGANIKVPAGTYQITFNTATGEYTFTK